MIKTGANNIPEGKQEIADGNKNATSQRNHNRRILILLKKRIQKIVLVFFVAVAGSVAALIVMEASLRIKATNYKNFDLTLCQSLDRDFHHVMIPDSTCRYKTSEWDVIYKINSSGLRNHEIVGKPKDTLRIIFLGDSFVQGHGVNENEAFTKILEEELNKTSSKPVEVINAGVLGYSPLLEYLYLYKGGLALNPDLVMTAFSLTDFWEDRQRFRELVVSYPNLSDEEIKLKIASGQIQFDFEKINKASDFSQKVYLPQVSFGVKHWLRENLKIYGFLADFIKNRNKPIQTDVLYQGNIDKDIVAIMRGEKIADRDWQKLWELPMYHIKLMSDFLKGNNIPLIIVAIPDAVQVSDREWPGRKGLGYPHNFSDPRGPFQKELANRLTEINVSLFDLLPGFQSSNFFPLYFTNDGHWNKNGHKLASEIIFKFLAEEANQFLLIK